MMSLAMLLVGVYFLSGMALLLQGALQVSLIQSARRAVPSPEVDLPEAPPHLLVQLPLYNEEAVATRLLDAVARLEWDGPLTVQILDDSTDSTTEQVRQWLAAHPAKRWHHLHRANRAGFKAGALMAGLEAAPEAAWVAIFDADFVPPADFLKRAGKALSADSRLAAVQGRWAHLNAGESALTRVQAFNLDAHFTVEQQARSNMGGWAAFNGTAGLWRRAAIADAGGWCADTLAEDLDLSVRAHLKGWGIRYLDHVAAPAELPTAFSAYATQQHRWTSGGAGCARKHARTLLSKARGQRRRQGLGQLFSSSIHVPVWVMTTASVPLVALESTTGGFGWVLPTGAVFAAALVILVALYFVAYRRRGHEGAFAPRMVGMLLLGTGMTWRNVRAVWLGWVGRPGGFVRTPKGGAVDRTGRRLWPAEIGWALYFTGGLALGAYTGEWGLMPYHALLAGGYGWVAAMAVRG